MLTYAAQPRARGFALLEALIAIVVLAIGLLGLAKLQVGSQQLATESYQRAQAVILLQDMVNRLRANRGAALCYAVTTDAVNGTPWLGHGFNDTNICSIGTATQQQTAIDDLDQWNLLLQGTSETASGTNVGAMVLARGCISYDGTTDEYLVTVVWYGLMPTWEPTVNCANDGYDNPAQRRAVSAAVRFANLI